MCRQYKHVSLAERVEIEKLSDQGQSQAEIARRLGRSRSTISREVARRSWRPSNTSASYTPYRPAGLRAGEWTQRQYRATIAQVHADRAAARSHQARVMRSDALVTHVRDRLRRGWTPEEIAGRLPLEFPDDPTMRVSHETLYAWIYAPAQKTLGLWQYLARGLRKRRKRGSGRRTRRAPQIRFRVGIEDRPDVVEDRAEFGHWEADSVLGVRGTGALHTEVERTSRFLVATRIGSVTAQATVDAQQAMIAGLPAHAVKSITADNGSEFAFHHQLADSVGVPTYFAVPYSAWQRGTNEHFNGRIRKYLPKRTRLDTITEGELADIITEINNRPRKVLGWKTPAEVFSELCST
jgi:IS30 family transposase